MDRGNSLPSMLEHTVTDDLLLMSLMMSQRGVGLESQKIKEQSGGVKFKRPL